MSYTIENTEELFLVTKHYGENDDLHIIMSKREIQSDLVSQYRHLITNIKKIEIKEAEEVSKKIFLPKSWQKINKRTVCYNIWKEIAEGEPEEK